jgi:hypothetical protein
VQTRTKLFATGIAAIRLALVTVWLDAAAAAAAAAAVDWNHNVVVIAATKLQLLQQQRAPFLSCVADVLQACPKSKIFMSVN